MLFIDKYCEVIHIYVKEIKKLGKIVFYVCKTIGYLFL